MDEKNLFDVILRKRDDLKEKTCKYWLTVYSILADLLRQNIQKKRLLLMDRIIVEVSTLKKVSANKLGEICKEEDLQEFLEITCKMYVINISHPKMNQRIIKVIQVMEYICPDLTKKEITKTVDAILSNKQAGCSTQTLQYVIIIIESLCSLGRGCIEEKLDKVLLITAEWCNRLMNKLEKSSKTNVVNYQDHLLIVIKAALQMFQNYSSKIRLLSLNENNPCKQYLKTVITFLMSVLFSKVISKECLLLASTALSFLLNSEPDGSQVVNIITQLLDHTGDKNSTCDVPKNVITIFNLDINLPVAGYAPLTHIAILQAIIMTSRRDVILYNEPNVQLTPSLGFRKNEDRKNDIVEHQQGFPRLLEFFE